MAITTEDRRARGQRARRQAAARGRRCSAAWTIRRTSLTLSVTSSVRRPRGRCCRPARPSGEPAHEPRPVGRAEQHDREVPDLAGLAQRRGLEQLVERAEPAGEDDERARVADEHHLAREEVVEARGRCRRSGSRTARAAARCRGRSTVAPASRAPRLPASMIPGPPPVMIEKPARAEHGGGLARLRVHRVVARRAGRAEDRDRLPMCESAANPAAAPRWIRRVRASSSSWETIAAVSASSSSSSADVGGARVRPAILLLVRGGPAVAVHGHSRVLRAQPRRSARRGRRSRRRSARRPPRRARRAARRRAPAPPARPRTPPRRTAWPRRGEPRRVAPDAVGRGEEQRRGEDAAGDRY